MVAIASLLAKVRVMKGEVIAAQPIDILSTLSPYELDFFNKWIAKFDAQHSEPDALYDFISRGDCWSPFDWLSISAILVDQNENQAAQNWNNCRDGMG